MIKARTIYVWEGEDTFTFTKGTPMVGDRFKECMIKHRGLLSSFFSVTDIEDIYVGQSKALRIAEKIIPHWNVVKIMLDYKTKKPFIPDFNPALVAKIKSLTSAVEAMRRAYNDERQRTQDLQSRDRMHERVKKELQFASDVKQKLFHYSDGGFGGLGSRWGLGGGSFGGSGDNV